MANSSDIDRFLAKERAIQGRLASLEAASLSESFKLAKVERQCNMAPGCIVLSLFVYVVFLATEAQSFQVFGLIVVGATVLWAIVNYSQRQKLRPQLNELKYNQLALISDLATARSQLARDHCPPPLACAKCGEDQFEITDISPNWRSVEWKCSYCGRKERVIGNNPEVASGREPIAKQVQREVWQRDGGRCVACGNNANLEFDHIIPLSRGGSNSVRNLQLLCEACNRKKSAKEPGNY